MCEDSSKDDAKMEAKKQPSEASLRLNSSQAISGDKIDSLVEEAVFGVDDQTRGEYRRLIRELASSRGIYPASIQGLYDAAGKGLYHGITVPAINIRGLTYQVARAVFRAARKYKVGAFIFEIARSEIGYTKQSPMEYAACLLAAAIREGFQGPVFIQGDHFQVSRSKYHSEPEKEIKAIKQLILEAVSAGFLIAEVKLDFETLKKLSKAAREEYGMSGAVQHGASTLSDGAFELFPQAGTTEVHLATGFQNAIYDSPYFPRELLQEINGHLLENYQSERKPEDTEDQFLYKTRKKAWGDFKKEIWSIPDQNLREIGETLENRFSLLFQRLNVVETIGLVSKFVVK